jgi:hypothetical protein
VVGEQNPSRPSINWDSNDKTLFPPIQKLPSFIRHFAVCLIPLDVWDDPTKSLIQRFQNGTYWELIGPDPVPREGDCVGWTEEKIRHIDAIEDIGVTAFGNFVVSEDGKSPRGSKERNKVMRSSLPTPSSRLDRVRRRFVELFRFYNSPCIPDAMRRQGKA